MMSEKKSKLRSFLIFSVKLGIAAAIIIFLVHNSFDKLKACLDSFNYLNTLPYIIYFAICQLTVAWRWRRLARLQGFELSAPEAVSLTFQGCFFSLIIPGGAIGGDVVKMGLLAHRRPKGSRAEGVFTVFMDRVVGMLALFLLAIVLILLSWNKLFAVEIPGFPLSCAARTLILLGLLGICAAGICAGIAIFFHRQLRKLPLVGGLMNWCDRKFNNIVSRMTAMADLYRSYPGELTLLTAAGLFLIHYLAAVPMFFMFYGAGIPLWHNVLLITSAVTIGNIAGLLPFAPGGIGLRDLTVIAIMGAVTTDTDAVKAAQLLSTGMLILCNLASGLFFIFEPASLKKIPNHSGEAK